MNSEMIEYLLYSTDILQNTISAENDPLLVQANLETVFLPPGEYRMIAGKLMRSRKGVPVEERPSAGTAISSSTLIVR